MNMAVALANAQVNTVAFDIVIILSHIVMGTWLSCFILEFTQSYKIAYAVISLIVCLTCLLVDLFEAREKDSVALDQREFFVAILAVAMGALMHWCSKLGFVVLFITANSQKLLESLYRVLFQYYQGGAKLRGDVLIILAIVLVFMAGSISGALYYKTFGSNWSLLPVIVSYPLHLWLAGCLPIDISTSIKNCCCPVYDPDQDDELPNGAFGLSPESGENKLNNSSNPMIGQGTELVKLSAGKSTVGEDYDVESGQNSNSILSMESSDSIRSSQLSHPDRPRTRPRARAMSRLFGIAEVSESEAEAMEQHATLLRAVNRGRLAYDGPVAGE